MNSARTVDCSQHERYRGVCPACQRARLAVEQRQLAEVRTIRAAADPEVCRAAVVPGVRDGEGPRV